MAQSPLDVGQDSGSLPAPDRYAGATIVMNTRGGEPGRKPAESVRPEQLNVTLPVGTGALESAHESDEPSIEEYMTALLARTKQFSTSEVRETSPYVQLPVDRRAPPPTPAPPLPGPPLPGPSPTPSPGSPATAPECRDAFSELRELANISAQSTFNAHRAQGLVLEMHGKRFVAVVAMLASVVLLSLATGVRSPAYITAVAAVTTACAFSLKYLALGRELAQLCAHTRRHDGGDP